jgi:enoyl-CoA hydratase
MEPVILSTLDSHGILHITLNRPQQLNALNRHLLDELSILLTDAKHNPEIKALLLTGQGDKAFCAGADIKALSDLDSQTGLIFSQHGQAIFHQLEQVGKPSLAAINGYCFGGGCELATAASLRIACENASFSQPEVKLGVIPCYSGTQRLARLIGKGRAIDLCITARRISAPEALAWGLISEVTNANSLLERAQTILLNILSMAPIAVASVLASIQQGFDMSLQQAEQLESLQFALCCTTQDKHEGVHAFLEKRSPSFKAH